MKALLTVLAAAVALLAAAAARAETAVEDVLDAVVRIDAEIPADARTAGFLGTERTASGVVIDDAGLVLTIGYIILEAMAATVTDADGTRRPADIVAYDYDTGFGLLRADGGLAAKPLKFGDSDSLLAGDQALAVSAGGAAAATPVFVVVRDSFAGYWEYLLEDAIFTAPSHPAWAGAALVGADGRLLGIGSLRLPDAAPDERSLPGNMFVPINALKPILGDLLALGRGAGPPRPWMGLFTRDVDGEVVVETVIPDGPGAAAGVVKGDVITAVAGESVAGMADLFRKVWALGSAGVAVPLSIAGAGGTREVVVRSADRYRFLRLNPTY